MLGNVEEIPVILKYMCICIPFLQYKQILSTWADEWLVDHANIWIFVELGGKIDKMNALIFP